MKAIIYMAILCPAFCFSQNRGLAVDMQYQSRIEDQRRYNNDMDDAYNKRYNKLVDDYTYALGANELRDNPKILPESGTFTGIVTNRTNLMERAEIIVYDNKVTVIIAPNGNRIPVNSSTTIQNFRAIVTMPDGNYREIIFTYLFN